MVKTISKAGLIGVCASAMLVQAGIAEEQSNRLPGFDTSVPNKLELDFSEDNQKQEPKDGAAFFADNGNRKVSASLTAKMQGQGGDIEDALRGDAMLAVGVDLGYIAAELEISVEELINRALDDDIEDNGDAISNGLTSSLPKDLLHKLRAIVTPFRYSKDGQERVAITIVAGRDNATPLGTYVPEWIPSYSVLIPRQLDEQDLIKVQATVFENTMLEVVSFGHDVLGYYSDSKEDLDQDGSGSFAVNLKHIFELQNNNELEVWISYASVDEGTVYTRALASDQPGENETISAGAKLEYNKLTISAEGFVLDSEMSEDEEVGAQVLAMYEIDRVIPFAGIEILNDGENTDLMTSLGAGYKIANNLMLAISWQHVAPENGDSQNNIFASVTLTDDQSLEATAPTE